MPGTLKGYNPDNSELEKMAAKERDMRAHAITNYWAWRDGNHPAPFKDKVVRDEQGVILGATRKRSEDNIIINDVGQQVDDMTAFVSTPHFSIPANNDSEPDEALEAALQAILEASEFDELGPDSIESGMVAGHFFLRLVEPDNEEPMSIENPPAIAMLDPRNVTVFWDVERAGMKNSRLWYRITWSVPGMEKRQDIVPSVMVAEQIGDVEPGIGGDMPVLYGDPDTWTIIESERTTGGDAATGAGSKWVEKRRAFWPWAFPPIVDGKALRRPHAYYGQSFVGDTGLNNSINFVASNTAKIIRHHAHPKTVVKDAQVEALPGSDQFIEIHSDGDVPGDVFNLEMMGDLGSSMGFLSFLRSVYYSNRRVVDPMSVREKAGQLTNFGLRTLYRTQIDLAHEIQASAGKVYKRALTLALAMMDYTEAEVMVSWDDVLPVDRKELVESLQVEVDMGLTSKQTASSDIDRDYETEQDRRAKETQDSQQATANALQLFGESGLL